MERDDAAYERTMWIVWMSDWIITGISCIVCSVAALLVALFFWPGMTGILAGAVVFLVMLGVGTYCLRRGVRMRKQSPSEWLAGEPRPEDEPVGKMR
jgi:uncharacterized membrane protein